MNRAIECDGLLRCSHLVTQDDQRRIIEDAGLAVDKGVVLAVGTWEEVSRTHKSANTIDGSGCLALPGLVNAHTHAAMTLFRGAADDMELMQWLTTRIWPLEAGLTRELTRLGAMMACAEMISTGTTCFADMYIFERETALAARECGMRGLLCEGILDFPTRSYQNPDQAFEVIQSLFDEFAGDPLINIGLAPHATHTTSPEILRRSRALSREKHTPWMIHAAENAQDTGLCLEKFGQRPIPYLHSLGLLGPGALIIHAVDLDQRDIDLLAETKSRVIHCPKSNSKLASGAAPAAGLLAAGVGLALGTDGPASNNNLNMFSEMFFSAVKSKLREFDPKTVPAQCALDMATVNGALALARPELGSLAPGKAADLCLLDLSRPNLAPLYNPVSQAVYAANGSEVRLTMINGQIVYQDGQFLSFDYPALVREFAKARQWVLDKLAAL